MKSITNRIRRHLSDPKSHHRRIATGFLWVSLFVLVGRLAGAAKEMAIAWRFGTSETVDAYVFVFNLINFPISVWFSILTIVLIPLAIRISRDDPTELSRFRGEFLGLTIILGFSLGAAAWIGLPWILSAGWVGLTDQVLTEALRMTDAMSILIPIGMVIGLFSIWILASGHHRNTLYEAIPAIVILVALVLPYGWISEPLLWGTVGGFVMHLFALAGSLRKKGELNIPNFSLLSPAWQGFWGGVGITAAGQVLMSLTSIADQFFVAGLGPGALASVGYANRIVALILGIGGMAIGRATLPIFSDINSSCSRDVAVIALTWAKWIFIGSLIAVGIVWLTSQLIVQLLFERGAFSSHQTEIVAHILRYGLLQVPFYMSGLVLVFALSSANKYAVIAIISFINLIIKLLLNHQLTMIFGVVGVLMASAIMYAVSGLLCMIVVMKMKKGK